MKTKNFQWLVAAVVVLAPVAYWSNQSSSQHGTPAAGPAALMPKNFFQAAAAFFGSGHSSRLSGDMNSQSPTGGHFAKGSVPMPVAGQAGAEVESIPGKSPSGEQSQNTAEAMPSTDQQTSATAEALNAGTGGQASGDQGGSNANGGGQGPGASTGTDGISGGDSGQAPGGQASSAAGDGSSTPSGPSVLPSDNAGSGAPQGNGDVSGQGQDQGAGDNTFLNSGSGNNGPSGSANDGSGLSNPPIGNSGSPGPGNNGTTANNPQNPPYVGCSLGCYPGCIPGCDPQCTPGCQSGNTQTVTGGYTPGCVAGCYPGCIPGCDPQCTPGCQLGNIQPTNSTLVYTIPTDAQAAQAVNQVNLQNQLLAALVAANQAMVQPAREQAEAGKYQTIDPSTIPAPDATPAPDDMVQRIKSAQLIQH